MVSRLVVVASIAVAVAKVYEEAVYDVSVTTKVEYGQGMHCKNDLTGCKPKSLQLEVYEPVAKTDGPAVEVKKPAYILAHGGANSGGKKEQMSFQGAAKFYASRGFVAFNIDYRLAGDHGSVPPPPWPAKGTKLVSHVGGNDAKFWPHPDGSSDPYMGVLKFGNGAGQLSGLCMALEADGKSVSLQPCDEKDKAQIWNMAKWTIDLQAIHHVSSGKCLDVPDAATKQAENLVVEVGACSDASSQKFILGHSGMLWCQRYGGLSIGSEFPPPPWPAKGSKLASHMGGNDDKFFPHPDGSSDPYTGVFQLGNKRGQLSGLCMAVQGKSVSLQPCNAHDAAQIWNMAQWNTYLQPIHHVSSGKCLDIPGVATKEEANLLVEVGNCNDASSQKFIFDKSGELWVNDMVLSVMVTRSLADWNPDWASGYPAVRDSKAAVRFVRANCNKFGVDPDKIAVSGGSAGATNMLAVGATFDGDYKDEISEDDDPTLNTTNLKFSSKVHVVVGHWSSNGEIDLIQQHDPKRRSRYTKHSAPVIEFHGDADGIIPLDHAKAVQTAYANVGVDYELHVLSGCGHGAWCYDGLGGCSCPGDPTGYGDHMDKIALPFVAKHLGVDLQPNQIDITV